MKQKEDILKPDNVGMYHFVCECGGGMAINLTNLNAAMFQDKYFKCPNKLYGKCNRSYSAKILKDKSLFIPPQNFQSQ